MNQLTLYDYFNKVHTKIEKSTSTIDEIRVPIFAPVAKITKRSRTYQEFIKNKNVRIIKTQWGEAEVRNRLLTDTHKTIMDVVMSIARIIKNEQSEGGIIGLYFSLYELKKVYSDKGLDERSRNYQWFKEKLYEIRDTLIRFRDKSGNEYDFNIITHLELDGKQGNCYLELDNRYVRFYGESLSVNYKQELKKLISVRSPLLRSVIRFFFTHEKFTIDVDSLLEMIGYTVDSERQVRNAKKEIRDNAALLKGFGIEYKRIGKKDVLSYVKLRTVTINPITIELVEDKDTSRTKE